jgi:hypothetical protein
MKKLVIICAVILGIAACKSNDKKDSDKNGNANVAIDSAATTSISWLDSTFIDIGKIKQGAEVEVTFRFKNIGNKPLVIKDVRAGCGCTIPEKPSEPFSPGQEGKIKAKFNSQGQSISEHIKNVTVVANTSPESTFILHFRVEVTE